MNKAQELREKMSQNREIRVGEACHRIITRCEERACKDNVSVTYCSLTQTEAPFSKEIMTALEAEGFKVRMGDAHDRNTLEISW